MIPFNNMVDIRLGHGYVIISGRGGHKYSFMPSVQQRCNNMAVEVKAGMSNYTSLFYVDVINNPCPNPVVGLANLC